MHVRFGILLGVFLLMAAYGQTSAVADLSDPLLHVDATSVVDGSSGPVEVSGAANVPVDFTGFDVNHQPMYALDSNYSQDGYPVYDSTNTILLGTIDGVHLTYGNDPFVKLNVLATAGAADTTFTFNSAVVSFAPLTNVQGVATAQLGATDNREDGVSLTGLYPGGKAYEAIYNPGSNLFSYLVSSFSSAIPNSSPQGTETYPTSGTLSIPGTLDSIQSQMSFVLSAGDSMSGTSRFTVTGDAVVPEPSTMALLASGAGGLLLAGASRMRRR